MRFLASILSVTLVRFVPAHADVPQCSLDLLAATPA
jgi:hypothetical protein